MVTGVLSSLWFLWVALLSGGVVLDRLTSAASHRIAAWVRLASSVALVVAAWGLSFVIVGTLGGAYTRLIALGMTLGLLGDLFLARVLPLPQPIILGIAAFGLGHLAYIAGILSLASRLDLVAGPMLLSWLIWLALGALGWHVTVQRGQQSNLLHRLALLYALLLATTAGVAVGVALQQPRFWALALGAALFFLSDLILAAGLFGGRCIRAIDDLIWLTYGPAQMLIVYSTALALLSPWPVPG